MLSKIIQFKSLNRSISKRFSEKKQSEVEQAKKEETQPPEQKTAYNYAKEKFDLVNSRNFIKKIEKMEQLNQPRYYQIRSILPFALLGGSLFIYHLWQVMPYSLIFKHTTVSEYIPREHYLHAILLAPLAFQTQVVESIHKYQQGHLALYFPLMAVSFFLCGKYLNNKYFAALYLTNALISTAVTFYYERKKNQQLNINMISPKCIGATTPLSFVSAFIAIKPNHLLLNNKALPFFIIPALYYMYEIQEFQSGYVNEVSRPAHLASIVWGFVFGLLFKNVVLKGIV